MPVDDESKKVNEQLKKLFKSQLIQFSRLVESGYDNRLADICQSVDCLGLDESDREKEDTVLSKRENKFLTALLTPVPACATNQQVEDPISNDFEMDGGLGSGAQGESLSDDLSAVPTPPSLERAARLRGSLGTTLTNLRKSLKQVSSHIAQLSSPAAESARIKRDEAHESWKEASKFVLAKAKELRSLERAHERRKADMLLAEANWIGKNPTSKDVDWFSSKERESHQKAVTQASDDHIAASKSIAAYFDHRIDGGRRKSRGP